MDPQNQKAQTQLDEYRLEVAHDFTLGWSSKEASERPWPLTGGLIVSPDANEHLVAGSGPVITFETVPPDVPIAGITSIQEGRYVNDQSTGSRRFNGDQSHQGRYLRILAGQWSILRVKLYRHRWRSQSSSIQLLFASNESVSKRSIASAPMSRRFLVRFTASSKGTNGAQPSVARRR